MMLPKVIYELIPYFYMSAGVAEISYFHTRVSTVLGLVIFLVGTFIWIIRSEHRRQDPKVTRKERGLNNTLYEAKPFLLILCGVVANTWTTNWAIYPLALCFMLLGIYFVFLRTQHRSRRRLYIHEQVG